MYNQLSAIERIRNTAPNTIDKTDAFYFSSEQSVSFTIFLTKGYAETQPII
jgi:hypothetical protein